MCHNMCNHSYFKPIFVIQKSKNYSRNKISKNCVKNDNYIKLSDKQFHHWQMSNSKNNWRNNDSRAINPNIFLFKNFVKNPNQKCHQSKTDQYFLKNSSKFFYLSKACSTSFCHFHICMKFFSFCLFYNSSIYIIFYF